MGMYRTICYKVEDVFIKMLSKGKNPDEVKQNVIAFRTEKEQVKLDRKKKEQLQLAEKKEQQEAQRAEQERIAREKAQKKHEETLYLLTHFVACDVHEYNDYEYRAAERNSAFFESVKDRVFEPGEVGITFLQCEFDKTKTREYPGFLFVTDKRVWFVAKNMVTVDKFRYQTIRDVRWFKDGLLEKGLYIQYGKRRLEFDEIFDKEQLQRVGDLILRLATN